MPRFIALEWDSHEARVVIARVSSPKARPRRVVLEQAFDVDLAPRDAEDIGEVDVAARIRAALEARGIGRVEALVAVSRTQIELRMLSLPPAPPEELPQLVRFQAQRQFSHLTDQWPLDFLPMGDEPEGNQQVLAAAIAPAVLEQIQQTCTAAELKLVRLALRPAAASWLLAREAEPSSQGITLFIDRLADEADLTVLDGRQLAVMRTVKLSRKMDDAALATLLQSEARRTIAAAQNQLGGRKVEQIVLCGTAEENDALLAELGRALELEVARFDPFARFELAKELRSRLPRYPGRFAPLLGMLEAEAESAHPIDFLNPRQPPAAVDRRRQIGILAAVAALVVLLVGGILWSRLSALKDEELRLAQQLKSNEELVKRAELQRRQLDDIRAWAASDITWLDELRELSRDMPPAEQAVLSKLQWGALDKGGGQIGLEGLVANSDTLTQLELGLRDEAHPEVRARGTPAKSPEGDYGLTFKASVAVAPPDLDARSDQRGDPRAAAPPVSSTKPSVAGGRP